MHAVKVARVCTESGEAHLPAVLIMDYKQWQYNIGYLNAAPAWPHSDSQSRTNYGPPPGSDVHWTTGMSSPGRLPPAPRALPPPYVHSQSTVFPQVSPTCIMVILQQ